jgi:hypothetical protein
LIPSCSSPCRILLPTAGKLKTQNLQPNINIHILCCPRTYDEGIGVVGMSNMLNDITGTVGIIQLGGCTR